MMLFGKALSVEQMTLLSMFLWIPFLLVMDNSAVVGIGIHCKSGSFNIQLATTQYGAEADIKSRVLID
jgi:hypothetical protein